MSDEIIKVLENLIQENKELKKEYERVKEKNKELEEFGEHIKIFREKNLSSEIDYVIALKSNFMGYLKTDYVSKDKIRETIKELEGQEIWYIQNKGLDELYGRIDMLKELLEEE